MLKDKSVDHPSHYGGAFNPYEAIKVIEAWDLGFHLGSAVKYIARMGKKNGEPPLRDLKKSAWYIAREIERLEKIARMRRRNCAKAYSGHVGECDECEGMFCVHGADLTEDGVRCPSCDAITRRQEKRKNRRK